MPVAGFRLPLVKFAVVSTRQCYREPTVNRDRPSAVMKSSRSGLPSRYLAEARRMHMAAPRLRLRDPRTLLYAMFWLVAFVGLTAFAYSQSGSDCGTYINSAGSTVRRPCGNWFTQPVPTGAMARCRDGSFSFSQHPHAPGSCSYHWGVAYYL